MPIRGHRPGHRAARGLRATCLARAAAAAALVVLLLAVAQPGLASGPAAYPSRAVHDLGAPRADGVTMVDSLDSDAHVKAYAFRVDDGAGAVHVYLGDLWYDVDVLLWHAPMLPNDPAQWRTMPCDNAAGCMTGTPPSARRRIQFIQPKTLLVPVDPGSYALVVRPREQIEPSVWRPFTLRVAVTPPPCAVTGAHEAGYLAALVTTPARPRRADLVTLTAYVLPPFEDLFDFEWSVDGRRLAATGPTAQLLAFELGAGGASGHQVQVVARGARSYPDPDQPEIPPTLSVGCPLMVG
jgi:hypothetical protein